jgi:hypothetical protein
VEVYLVVTGSVLDRRRHNGQNRRFRLGPGLIQAGLVSSLDVTSASGGETYTFAGADMTSYVRGWLTVLDGSEAVCAGLLEDAACDPVRHHRYPYGAMFVTANIAPQAAQVDASHDELRLFAVLGNY